MEKFLKTTQGKRITAAIVILILAVAGFFVFNRDRTQDYIAFQDSLYEEMCGNISGLGYTGCLLYTPGDYYGNISNFKSIIVEKVVKLVNDSSYMQINCGTVEGKYRQNCQNQQNAIKTFMSMTNNGTDYENSDKKYLDDVFRTIKKQ